MSRKNRNPNVPRFGVTPYERDLLAGMVYLLVDARAEALNDYVIGVYDTPVKAIVATGTDAKLWHHYCEHYWIGGGGKWEITPYMLNLETEWKRREWEEARPRMRRMFRLDPIEIVIGAPDVARAEVPDKVLARIERLGAINKKLAERNA